MVVDGGFFVMQQSTMHEHIHLMHSCVPHALGADRSYANNNCRTHEPRVTNSAA